MWFGTYYVLRTYICEFISVFLNEAVALFMNLNTYPAIFSQTNNELVNESENKQELHSVKVIFCTKA